MAAAGAGVAEARAALRTSGSLPNPTVSYSHSEPTPRDYLLVDQPLDWLLRRGTDRAAARAGMTRAEADSSLSVAGLLRDVRIDGGLDRTPDTRADPTALPALRGALPLSLGLGVGAELQRRLALAVIGGLVVSTLVTLLIVPVLVEVFGDLEHRGQARRAASKLDLAR